MKPPEGLKTFASGYLDFKFKNEDIADEFLELNNNLAARVYSFKQNWKEIKEEVKKIGNNEK